MTSISAPVLGAGKPKKGAFRLPQLWRPSPAGELDGSDGPTGGTLDLAGVQATGADLDLDDLSILDDARHLEIGLPGPAGLVVGVRHVVAEGDSLLARVAHIAGDRGHGQFSIS